MRLIFQLLSLSAVIFLFSGCSSTPKRPLSIGEHGLSTLPNSRFSHDKQPSPKQQNDVCQLLRDYPHWRKALNNAKKRWGIEPWLELAFIHQESRFHPTAMSRSKAYGYAQVKAETWQWYVNKTGNTKSKRQRFDDATDFIGFYVTENKKRNGVAINNVKNQYLAYHEGMGGFEQGSYIGKPWLLGVADKVVERAKFYQAQLIECPS